MTMYVCIENNVIKSVLNYEPNVPSTVDVVSITESEYDGIVNGTLCFDVNTKTVKPVAQTILDKKQQEANNIKNEQILRSTDWQVLRHLREKALGLSTSLTDDEYITLEQQRQQAADNIVR